MTTFQNPDSIDLSDLGAVRGNQPARDYLSQQTGQPADDFTNPGLVSDIDLRMLIRDYLQP